MKVTTLGGRTDSHVCAIKPSYDDNRFNLVFSLALNTMVDWENVANTWQCWLCKFNLNELLNLHTLFRIA